MGINFVTGFCFVTLRNVLNAIGDPEGFLTFFEPVFHTLPPYNFGEGLMTLVSTSYTNEISGSNISTLGWGASGKSIFLLAVEAVVYFGLCLLLESPILATWRASLESFRMRVGRRQQSQQERGGGGGDGGAEGTGGTAGGDAGSMWCRVRVEEDLCGFDDDVAAEQRAVDALNLNDVDDGGGGHREGGRRIGDDDDDDADDDNDNDQFSSSSQHPEAVVILSHLRKVYPPPLPHCTRGAKHALRGLSFAIPRSEVFGFLGHNGAGKTTALSILTGELRPTSGSVRLKGLDPSTNPGAVARLVGYCPQADPLLGLMTATETLTMFGRLKGIPPVDLEAAVAATLEHVGLSVFAHQMCGSYSGGNKRKLSFAVALIGGPPILLLDEPSSGMDPIARRQMWDAVSRAAHGRSVIITTHSMQECEALATRVGIMAAGTLRCIGSCQHLKNRHGSGFWVETRCDEGRTVHVVDFIQKEFPGAGVENECGGFLRFAIPTLDRLTLAGAFRLLEDRKDEEGIHDYSISQGSLESVFLRFAEDDPQRTAAADEIAERSESRSEIIESRL